MTDAAFVTPSRSPIPRVAGHPVTGHLGAFRVNRAQLQLDVARVAPDIARIRIGLVPLVLVGAPALAHEVLVSKADAFVKSPGLSVFLRPVLGDGLLTSEDSAHSRQRKLLAPAFAHKRVSSYVPTMVGYAEAFAERLREGEEIDVVDAMNVLTLEIVGKTLFDADVRADASDIGEAVTEAMEVTMNQIGALVPLPPIVPSPANLRLRRAIARLDRIVYRIIHDRRSAGVDRGDLLSILLSARDETGLGMTDRQVRDEAMTLLLAGHETTANALAWTWLLLAQHPDVRARLEAEVDALGRDPTYGDLEALPYTLAVLEEAMRLYPPVYLLGRRARRRVDLGAHAIARGAIVLLNTLAIHRRPELYEEPERFRPERFLGDAKKALPRCAYLPFGAGPRICIGNHFALMEGHLVLATLARRLRLERTSNAPVELEPLVTLRPRGAVRMRVTRRAPVTA